MKKNYTLFLSGILAAASLTSCNRAVYSLPAVTAAHQPQTTVTSAPLATEAPVLVASVSPAPLSPESTAAPVHQAATALATAPASAAPEAGVMAPARPAKQAANQQPQTPAKPAKISKGVWIGIGVGVVLAVLRILVSS